MAEPLSAKLVTCPELQNSPAAPLPCLRSMRHPNIQLFPLISARAEGLFPMILTIKNLLLTSL